MVSIPSATISSSDGPRHIPVIGLGTGTVTERSSVKAAVVEAIKVGYRHFDTATFYGTEKPVGEAIAEALQAGFIKSRSELFVTTKLWPNSTERHLVLPALKKSLQNLGLEYVDLYLIHWPLKINYPDIKIPVPREYVTAIDIKAVWEAMEECQNLGLTKSIGVSNFSSQKIQEILSFAKIPPAVNQVEMNPLWQQNQLNEFCKKNHILLTAYSPLASVGNSWGNNSVVECEILQDIAKSKGKTTAQISLRWLYEQGVSFIVKSFNKERMTQNLRQLGVDGDNSIVPCLVKMPITDDNGKISSVKAGHMTSLAIDDLGRLWMWGNLQGISSEVESTPIPTSINFNGHTVIKVSCGEGHIVALVNNGDDLSCYSWGNNYHGQLGLGDTEFRPNPQMIDKFNTLEAYEVACGASHTCVLAYTTKTKTESICWTFGRGSNGQLGLGTTQDSPCPEMVTGLPGNLFLVSVDCGLFHTSVVSSSGNVWSWGMQNGLGLCPEATFAEGDGGDALSPRLINGPNFPQPIQVACGAAHTIVVAEGGYKLWSWGRGRSGVLGNGQEVDFFSPKAVLWPPPSEEAAPETVGKKMEKDPEELTDTEKKLSAAMEEMNILRSKLSVMEQYASILHGSIFGRPFDGDRDIPVSLRDSRGTFDITKEWENMLESCDRGRLIRLQMFYRNMVAGVEDKMMKQRIKEMLKEFLGPSAAGTSLNKT